MYKFMNPTSNQKAYGGLTTSSFLPRDVGSLRHRLFRSFVIKQGYVWLSSVMFDHVYAGSG